jgi:phospholipase/lecithinase/hemolysin
MAVLKSWAIAGALAATLVGGASAGTFSQLVVFGDSLSDAGNAAAITANNFPPSPFPYAGPASNGPTAAQYLAQRFGVPVELGWPVTTATSNNFAVLGGLNGVGNYNVQIGNPPGLGAVFPTIAGTGIGQQIARYQSQHPVVPDAAHTLFMVWGGPNNAFLAVESPGASLASISQAMTLALADLMADIQQLAAMGAAHILVPKMPDLGLTPEALAAGPGAQAVLSLVTQGYNLGIDQLLAGLDAALSPLGVALYDFDTPAFFADITANAAGYGFTNTTQSCFNPKASPLDFTGVLGGCAGYLYFDNVHPSTAAHALLANAFAARVPEPAGWALVLASLAALALVRSRRAVGHG